MGQSWDQIERRLEESGALLVAVDIEALRQRLGLNKLDFSHLVGATCMSVHAWEKSDRKAPRTAAPIC